MRVLLEKMGSGVNTDYLDDFVYNAKMAAVNMAHDVVNFDGTDLQRTLVGRADLDINNDVVVGSVEACSKFFNKCGIATPDYLGYPESLYPFLGREIVRARYEDIVMHYPFFVKPADEVKLFTGSVVANERQYKSLLDFELKCKPETWVYVSEVVEFKSEYRCFVYDGKLKGIQFYRGDYTKFPDIDTINSMIEAYTTAPIAYTLDVGVVETKKWPSFFNENSPTPQVKITSYKTALVEVNDMWAIASYGFNGEDYLRMTIARFAEIAANDKEHKKTLIEKIEDAIKSPNPVESVARLITLKEKELIQNFYYGPDLLDPITMEHYEEVLKLMKDQIEEDLTNNNKK